MKSLALVLLCLIAAPTFSARAEEAPASFVGSIVYAQRAQGDSDGAEAFRGLAAERIVVHIGTSAYRQDEHGGLNDGSVLVREGSPIALRLEHSKMRSERGGVSDLEKIDEKVKALLPWQFKTKLATTGERDTICGYPVERFRVKESGFVRKGATAHVWIAPTLRLPRRRFQFEFKSHRIVSPLPLSIPVEAGTILKVEVVENNVPVTITATKITRGEPAAALFRKPAGYEGPDLPSDAASQGTASATAAGKVLAPLTAEQVSQLSRSLTNAAGMKLVLVLPGIFAMGSPEDEPGRHDDEVQHQVTLRRPYYVGIHEVTQAQWQKVMGAPSPSHFRGDDLPVESVTWAQARAFCRKLSEQERATYRLPTEAEWEYAARAGDGSVEKSHRERKAWLAAHAWQYFNAKYRTHPVGTLKPNAWGLYDTIGNVGEWVGDGMGPYAGGTSVDPRGSANEQKIVRGSGWVSSHDFCRPACRAAQPAAKAKSTIGFRIVREP